MEPLWYIIAKRELGVQEVAGNKDNPRIVEYLRTVFDYDQHDEVAWCSAFVNWCILQSGLPGNHSALARSWAWYGEQSLKPERGDIMVFRRGKEPWMGHVGFFDKMISGQPYILGGNQGNRVCYALYSRDQLVAIRRPTYKDIMAIQPTGQPARRASRGR